MNLQRLQIKQVKWGFAVHLRGSCYNNQTKYAKFDIANTLQRCKSHDFIGLRMVKIRESSRA